MRKIKRNIVRHKLNVIGQKKPNKVLSQVMKDPKKMKQLDKLYDKEMAKRKKAKTA